MTMQAPGTVQSKAHSAQQSIDEAHKMVDEILDIVGGLESKLSPILPPNTVKPSGVFDTAVPPDPGRATLVNRVQELRPKLNVIMGRLRYMLDENQL